MTDLLDAVDALTKPTRTKVDGCICPKCRRSKAEYHTITHDPLLVQLAAAVTSTITGKAGGGGQSTGNVLNSGALFRASVISSQISEWCRNAGARVVRGDMAGNLTRWVVAFAGSQDEARFREATLDEWAGTIRGLLNPRGTFQVTDPCVVCKATAYTDEEEVEHQFPVVVEYDLADPLRTAVAKCLVCEAQWAGREAVEELGEELSTVLDE